MAVSKGIREKSRSPYTSPLRSPITSVLASPLRNLSDAAVAHKIEASRHKAASTTANISGHQYLSAAESDRAASELRQAAALQEAAGDFGGAATSKIEAHAAEQNASVSRMSVRHL
jgi:hypothetical protein